MKTTLILFALSATLLWGNFTPAAQASVMLQPVGASTSMGSSAGNPGNTINQSGLSVGYTSLVTDFDAYIASNPTHNGFSDPNTTAWISLIRSPTGNFDFDLGGTFTIEAFALWNLGGSFGFNLNGFELLASADSSFSNTTSLGSFNASLSGSTLSVPVQVFDFTATSAAFVRMVITSNHGSAFTGFGEAAFKVQTGVVPEAGSLAIWTLLAATCSVVAYRRRGRAGV